MSIFCNPHISIDDSTYTSKILICSDSVVFYQMPSIVLYISRTCQILYTSCAIYYEFKLRRLSTNDYTLCNTLYNKHYSYSVINPIKEKTTVICTIVHYIFIYYCFLFKQILFISILSIIMVTFTTVCRYKN